MARPVQSRTMSAEKKATIRRQAAAVFAEKGFDRASIRDVAKATGMSLAGLYYYYCGKDEILYDIQYEAFRTLLDIHAEQLAGVTDPKEKLEVIIDAHCTFFSRNIAEMKVMSRESEQLAEKYAHDLDEMRRRYVRLVRGILDELGVDAVPPAVATFLLFGMMNWLYTWYDPERETAAEVATAVKRIFLEGIRGQ